MQNYDDLQHIFLIAMPSMKDPDFERSVVYIWEYDEHGAAGIIINKPMDVYLGELLRQIDVREMTLYAENYPVLYGGPVVNDQLFIVRRQHHDIKDKEGVPLFEITISSAKPDVIMLAMTDWANEAIVGLGCSTWGPGQLDKELANNDWLVVPFSEATLFGTGLENIGSRNSEDVWYSAAKRAGIDLNRLSSDAGHA